MAVVVLGRLGDGTFRLFGLSQFRLGLVELIEQKVGITQLKLHFSAQARRQIDPVELPEPTLGLLVPPAVEGLLGGL